MRCSSHKAAAKALAASGSTWMVMVVVAMMMIPSLSTVVACSEISVEDCTPNDHGNSIGRLLSIRRVRACTARAAMLLRALKNAGEPRIARAQYACPCHSRQLLILTHKVAHVLNGLFVSIPRYDVGLVIVVGPQFPQVFLHTIPALGPNSFALVHERGKVEVVSFDRVLDSCLLPCIGDVRGRYGATLHVEREQPRIVLVDGIEQLWSFIPYITVRSDPHASWEEREESAFLAVPGIPTDPEVLPVE